MCSIMTGIIRSSVRSWGSTPLCICSLHIFKSAWLTSSSELEFVEEKKKNSKINNLLDICISYLISTTAAPLKYSYIYTKPSSCLDWTMGPNSIKQPIRLFLEVLDAIQSTALRLTTGGFRTSPSLSLRAETSIMPLHYRRIKLTAYLLLSIAQNPSLPSFNLLFWSNAKLQI